MSSTLKQAIQLQQNAAELGFDWPCVADVFKKLDEEIDETKVAIAKQDNDAIEDELGDIFYTVINLSRHLNIDPEVAVARASAKFNQRFSRLQSLAAEENLNLTIASLEQLESLWQRIK